MSFKICGVTAEFNPFHEGHAYFLQEARRISGADLILVLMSPDFVQRGGPAIDDKYSRAEAALDAGADCVLELPVRYATGAAGTFADAAVSIFGALGIGAICFGSEEGQIEPLIKLSSVLSEETPLFQETLQQAQRSGFSYPAAVEKAIRSVCPNDTDLIRAYTGPNSRLGVEYLIALRKFPDIAAYTVPLLSGISASELRRKRFAQGLRGLRADDFSAVLFAKLAHTDEPAASSLTEYEDVSADLSARILREKDFHPTFSGLGEAVKTRAFTRTRIDRALTHILLGIKSDIPRTYPYLRVLGFRRSFEPAWKQLSESFSGKFVIRSSDAAQLDDDALGMYRQDRFASELWRGVRMIKYPDEVRKPEYSAGVILKE